MKSIQDPFKTTIKGLRSSADVIKVVQRIQNKLFERGIISDQEHEYLRTHSDWDRVNPRTDSNLG